MNSEREVSITVDRKGTCIWVKEEGSEVYIDEEIGHFVVSKDYRLPLRSPIEGKISKILIKGNQVVDGSEQLKAVAIVKKCLHAIVMNSICLNCFILVNSDILRSYNQIITYDGCVQYLHKDYYDSERINIQNNLLKNRKLGLVFDLDNTLMEQTDDLRCLEATGYGIPDVTTIRFHHNNRLTELVVMIRPNVVTVLTELKKYFDLSIYTNGIREYAVEVVRTIDPKGVLFGNRIIARNDIPEYLEKKEFNNAEPSSKDMRFVLPGYDTMGVSVDDNCCVWKDQHNVVAIPRFDFWRYFRSAMNRIQSNLLMDDKQRREEMFNAVGRIVNSSDMNTILNTLISIHKEFYSIVSEDNATKILHTTGEIMDKIRSSVLKGRIVYFDSTFHDEMATPLNRELHDKVRQLGGIVSSDFSSSVSHIISRGDESELLQHYVDYPHCRYVNELWIIACYSFLSPISSKCYPVRGIERFLNETRNGEEKITIIDPELADVLEGEGNGEGEDVDSTESSDSDIEEVTIITIEEPTVQSMKRNWDRDRRDKESSKELTEQEKREKRKRSMLD